MVLCGQRTCLGVLVVMVGIVFYAWPVFPNTISNPTLKSIYGVSVKLVTLLADTADVCGLSGVQVKRGFSEILTVFFKSYTNIERYKTRIDGVEVLILKPSGLIDDELHPAIVHFHGGGWVLYHPEFYLPEIHKVVEETQRILVSVNYRKAPEHIFPAALEDCVKVTTYLLRNGEQYGIDKNRLGLYGDSAGANLAMATALSLKDVTDTPKVKVMTLIYPALQALDFDLPSYNQYGNGPGFLTKKMMIEHWLDYMFGHRKYYEYFNNNSHISQEIRTQYSNRINVSFLPHEIQRMKQKGGHSQNHEQYLPKGDQKDISMLVINPKLAPLIASDEALSHLPPTFILTVEVDVLRDEGYMAKERLRNAGVHVEHTHLSSEQHGCLPFIEVTHDPSVESLYAKAAEFFNRHV